MSLKLKVPQGIIEENPASAKGVVEIMKHLKRFSPSSGDKQYPNLCNGDKLSVERMVQARIAMAGSEDPGNRLVGLEPTPQEFHKRCLMLQV